MWRREQIIKVSLLALLEEDRSHSGQRGQAEESAAGTGIGISFYLNNHLVSYETVLTESRKLLVNRQNKVSDPQKLKRCHVPLNLILKCCCHRCCCC